MNKDNENTEANNTDKKLHISDVTPRFSKEYIIKIAKERAAEMSKGDIKQDEECAYNYAQGMIEMQYRLLNEV